MRERPGSCRFRRQEKILTSYIDDFSKMHLANALNDEQGIHVGCYQDKRNSAMSFMADELGLGNIICRSGNVHIKYKDGGKTHTVQGTAMKKARGIDIHTSEMKMNVLKMSLSSLENPELIRQVAGLQVLDFLCGNADRHTANFSYDVDENGNLLGIQGFDNDSSLGSKFRATSRNGRKVDIPNFKIIPESVADKIMEMDSNDLKYMLHGFDLDAEEIQGALDRLELLKAAVTDSRKAYEGIDLPEGELIKNIPRIVKDENMGEYSFTRDLSYYEEGHNGVSYGNLFGALTRKFAAGKVVNDVNSTLSNIIQDNAKIITNDAWTDAAANIDNMKAENPRRALGSPQYDRMLAGTEELKEMLKEFGGPIYTEKKDAITGERSLVFSQGARKIREKIEQVRDLTETYINERAIPRRAFRKSKSSRAYKRYALAMKNKNMMQELEKCFSKIETTYEDRKALKAMSASIIAEAKKKDIELNKALNKKIEARKKQFYDKNKQPVVAKK